MISTTIKKKYFEMKMEDLENYGCLFEYKDTTTYWNSRLCNQETPTQIVFLVGNVPHRFLCTKISEIYRSKVPEKYRGAINTSMVWVLWCMRLHEGDER